MHCVNRLLYPIIRIKNSHFRLSYTGQFTEAFVLLFLDYFMGYFVCDICHCWCDSVVVIRDLFL